MQVTALLCSPPEELRRVYGALTPDDLRETLWRDHPFLLVRPGRSGGRIIGFDHPTASVRPEDNAKAFLEQWGRFLPEHTTAVRLLDRLLHRAHVVVTDGEPYRVLQARTKGTNPARNS